jgi:beta-glucosidase
VTGSTLPSRPFSVRRPASRARILSAFLAVFAAVGASGKASRPFGGVPRALPGVLEAEHFDEGGPGAGFSDSTPGCRNPAGRAVRATDVDLEPCGEGGYDAGRMSAGEWLAWTVSVTAGGLFSFEARVAAASGGARFRVEVDGSDATGPVEVPPTGRWQRWTTVARGRVPLSPGLRRVSFVALGPAPVSLNFLGVLKPTDGSGRTSLEEEPGLAGMPFRDPARPDAERVKDLVSRMTLAEKVSQLGTEAPAIPRLGLKACRWWNECTHGVGVDGATAFPHSIALAASWDPGLVREVAAAISREARALHREGKSGLTFFAPVMNIARDPRWGRTQETYGEDPFLAGEAGKAFVRGLQGDDPRRLLAVATPKHFAVNNDEARRHFLDVRVSERDLAGYYLPQFRAVVEEAGAGSVMCAYNSVNGAPCCANPRLLGDFLRGAWGFGGYVVSDCGAIDDILVNHRTAGTPMAAVADAIRAGCDLDCGELYQTYAQKAVREGDLAEAAVDSAVTRLMAARMRLGEFDPPRRSEVPPDGVDPVDSPAHRALARRAAADSFVLLKNDSGTLPLSPAIGSVAVFGPLAEEPSLGNYSPVPSRAVTPLEGLRSALKGARVSFLKGCGVLPEVPVPPASLRGPGGKPGLRAEYFGNASLSGKPSLVATEAVPSGTAFASAGTGMSVRWTGTLVPPGRGGFTLAVTASDGIRLALDGKVRVDQWRERPETTDRIAVRSRGPAPVRLRLEHFSAGKPGPVRLKWDREPPLDREAVRSAARAADAAVVMVGNDLSIENEGLDRADTGLPGAQEELALEVAAANPKTVVILFNGGALSVPRLASRVPALLEAWFPGEENGNALADVLLGAREPGGRLPVSVPASVADLPAFDDYAITRGRSYMYARKPPLFPFGYGLSYTEFTMDSLSVVPTRTAAGGAVEVSVRVANTGKRPGTHVIQLYLEAPAGAEPFPARRLRAFRKVALDPGEARTVSLRLSPRAMSVLGDDLKDFVPRGDYRLLVGPSSASGLAGSFTVL